MNIQNEGEKYKNENGNKEIVKTNETKQKIWKGNIKSKKGNVKTKRNKERKWSVKINKTKYKEDHKKEKTLLCQRVVWKIAKSFWRETINAE